MSVKAIVDLKVIIKNALAVKRRLPSETLFCAVVKADAYGHGAEEVANALYKTADYFAVATVEEGVRLRQAGIDKNILVLTKTSLKGAETAAVYSLMLTVSDLKDLRVYSRAAKAAKGEISVHIKYDTGMLRQGLLSLSELESALAFCKRSKFITAAGLYTHYAMPENEKSLNAASDKFSFAIKVAKRYNKDIICHASASGGFLRGKYYDMVRIGILLYGYKPFKSKAVSVTPAMKVLAPIIAKRSLNIGDCALYGEKRAERQTEFRLIRYGYADGLLRREIAGQFNNRCMDVTAAVHPKVKGGYAVVMDNAETLAKDYGTISYEILVKCALRAEKIYLR